MFSFMYVTIERKSQDISLAVKKEVEFVSVLRTEDREQLVIEIFGIKERWG